MIEEALIAHASPRILYSNVMKGRVYPTVPGLRVSFWFQFSDFTKESNIYIAGKTHLMFQIFQIFLIFYFLFFPNGDNSTPKNNNRCSG